MPRLISFALALALAGCAQSVTPVASAGGQPSVRTAGAAAARPADSVVAHVAFKNDAGNTEFTIYWSYAANPLWHVELQACLNHGDEFRGDVYFNHIKSGPQIKFGAEAASKEIFKCSLFRAGHRSVVFRSMIFNPDAHFHVRYTLNDRERGENRYVLCARGGGNAEVCDPKQ